MIDYNINSMEEKISLRKGEDGFWIIRHEESNITTQGKTRMEAMLMLVDALSDVSYFEDDEPLVENLEEDPMRMAARIFVPSREQEEFYRELKQEERKND
jgi:predicted RNase H-like HicB family nuclease